MTENEKDYDIFHGKLFLNSMRSSGYKDTSYAVAEIVDNAIDANATCIKILCNNKINNATNKYSLFQIAVLDDGYGMTPDELRGSLLFGDGTRGNNQKDIGKYGMGLPNSSLSQCKKVEVYSWQGYTTPSYTYIDLNRVEKGDKQIPIPIEKEIPVIWKKAAKNLSKKSGTLVIWNNLDRCTWTRSKTIMDHSTYLIGRIYRKFLHDKSIQIELITIETDDGDEILKINSSPMLPNDPMYLMKPSSTPGKWENEAMFMPDTCPEKQYSIDYDGQKHDIIVRCSIEKDELRSPSHGIHSDQGKTPHGKHARRNLGVSIMRADREISLDTEILTSIDSLDRWWGVEINIPPSLDDAVGLTNNKQRVNTLSTIMKTVGQFDDDEDNRDRSSIDGELAETEKQLFRMVREIRSDIASMNRRIRATRKNTRAKSSKPVIKEIIDVVIKKDHEDGRISKTDKDRESMEKNQRIDVIAGSLRDEGMGENESKKQAKQWIDDGEKIVFQESELEGSQFFNIQNIGGILRIKINNQHRAFKNLLALLESDTSKNYSIEDRLRLTKRGLWLLLASWARFEDLTANLTRKKLIQDIRYEWGKEIDVFLEQNDV